MNPEFPMRNTTLCYLEQDGKWLMLHRVTKKNDMNHDKWIGVGGKFEPFESPEDCLLREVREETGLQLTRFRCRGIVTFILGRLTEYMHLYTADGWTGELIRDPARNEGVLEWVPMLLICFVLPAVLSVVFCEIERKLGWIKEGDLKLN